MLLDVFQTDGTKEAITSAIQPATTKPVTGTVEIATNNLVLLEKLTEVYVLRDVTNLWSAMVSVSKSVCNLKSVNTTQEIALILSVSLIV